MSANDATTILNGAIPLSIPLLFAASGEYVAERAGTLNISIEGMMLVGAYTGIVLGGVVATPVALLGAVAAGLLVSVIHANFSHRLAANTFVVGLTLNALIVGITDYFATSFGFSPSHLAVLRIPGLASIPDVGHALFDEPWPAYILFALLPAIWWLVDRTRWGLEVRASGDNPQAADASGIRVNLRRRQALYLCGACSGLGGGYLSLGIVGTFNLDMTSGIGYVVIAAVIFGGWRLRGAIAGCLLFGGAQALSLVLPAIGVTLTGQILGAFPYALALIAMLFLARTHRAPGALAVPFERGLV